MSEKISYPLTSIFNKKYNQASLLFWSCPDDNFDSPNRLGAWFRPLETSNNFQFYQLLSSLKINIVWKCDDIPSKIKISCGSKSYFPLKVPVLGISELAPHVCAVIVRACPHSTIGPSTRDPVPTTRPGPQGSAAAEVSHCCAGACGAPGACGRRVCNGVFFVSTCPRGFSLLPIHWCPCIVF